MSAFVRVDAWQQQCWGDEFRVGSTVHWDVLSTAGGHEWADLLLRPAWGAEVRYQEDHHGGPNDPAAGGELHGVVRAIHVVTCACELRTGAGASSGGAWYPVPGSGRLREVEVADPWEPESPDDVRPACSFEGWIVEVDVEAA